MENLKSLAIPAIRCVLWVAAAAVVVLAAFWIGWRVF